MVTVKNYEIINDNWKVIVYYQNGDIEVIDETVCPYGHIMLLGMNGYMVKDDIDLTNPIIPGSLRPIFNANLVLDIKTGKCFKNRWGDRNDTIIYQNLNGLHLFIVNAWD